MNVPLKMKDITISKGNISFIRNRIYIRLEKTNQKANQRSTMTSKTIPLQNKKTKQKIYPKQVYCPEIKGKRLQVHEQIIPNSIPFQINEEKGTVLTYLVIETQKRQRNDSVLQIITYSIKCWFSSLSQIKNALHKHCFRRT